ncbi:Transcriptional regulator, LysR family [hydrothermal vent metagenome]|uniref:Transcriptional regulator, LysR family n=1 Tax=hydrothermal vent metagenome TaxID=652676 RepID=A0A3B0WPX4_9ZZZZ
MVQKIANTNLLDGVAVFVGVINAGSFTAAAQALGHSTSYVSKEITRLEKRLGSRLLNRTTRTISLTDAGRAYFERCNQIIIDAENAERSINQLQDTPRGLLRVNAPLSIGSIYLLDYFPEFMSLFPEINLEIEFNDRMIDVVAEAYDVVIRAGEIKNSNLIARKLFMSKSVVVASPAYLEKNGYPKETYELEQHSCLAYSLIPNPTAWHFIKNGKHTTVNFKPRVLTNNAELEIALMVKGVGIGRVPLFCCEKEIARSELEIILSDYEQPEIGVYAVFPHRQYLTAKVRVFVDFLVDKFSSD